MRRRNDDYARMRSSGVAFERALVPIEAAMLPARERRCMGALAHLRVQTQARFSGRKSASGTRCPRPSLRLRRSGYSGC